MAYAPVDYTWGDHLDQIVGAFTEKSAGNWFEYEKNSEDTEFGSEYPHKVWVGNPIPGLESGWRYAKVLKTVAYIVVDEDEYGKPVTEKWFIKSKWCK